MRGTITGVTNDDNDQRKKLREIVTEKEWQGKNADAEKCQIKILSAALQEGRSYYPAF